MCMVYGASGISAACFLVFIKPNTLDFAKSNN
jgi:hypothetical protein